MKYVGLAIMMFAGIVLFIEYQKGMVPPSFVWGVICIVGAILYATHRHDPKATPKPYEPAPDSSADDIAALGPTRLTWHCSCGEINVKSAKTCRSCGMERPNGG
ncbi:MAG: hypothetical protein ACYC0V_14025 [Armatimonadota bacterium]